MTEYDIKRLALVLATQAEIEGMKTANSERDMPSQSPAYTDDDFCVKAQELELLASKHDHQL